MRRKIFNELPSFQTVKNSFNENSFTTNVLTYITSFKTPKGTSSKRLIKLLGCSKPQNFQMTLFSWSCFLLFDLPNNFSVFFTFHGFRCPGLCALSFLLCIFVLMKNIHHNIAHEVRVHEICGTDLSDFWLEPPVVASKPWLRLPHYIDISRNLFARDE